MPGPSSSLSSLPLAGAAPPGGGPPPAPAVGPARLGPLLRLHPRRVSADQAARQRHKPRWQFGDGRAFCFKRLARFFAVRSSASLSRRCRFSCAPCRVRRPAAQVRAALAGRVGGQGACERRGVCAP